MCIGNQSIHALSQEFYDITSLPGWQHQHFFNKIQSDRSNQWGVLTMRARGSRWIPHSLGTAYGQQGNNMNYSIFNETPNSTYSAMGSSTANLIPSLPRKSPTSGCRPPRVSEKQHSLAVSVCSWESLQNIAKRDRSRKPLLNGLKFKRVHWKWKPCFGTLNYSLFQQTFSPALLLYYRSLEVHTHLWL